jgi:hypothetical protein
VRRVDGHDIARQGPLLWDRPVHAPERGTHPPLPWLPADARRARRPAAVSPRRRLLRWLAAHGRVTSIALGVLVLALAVPAVVMLRPGEPPGPHTVSTPFPTYTAPGGWAPEPGAEAPDESSFPAILSGVVHGPSYSCAGERHLRGFAATTLLPPDAAVEPAVRAESLARWFAAASYADGTPAEVSVAFTRPMQVPGRDGPVTATLTEVTATAAGGNSGCAAVEGEVRTLAAPVSGGVAVLLLAGDTRGGPSAPAVPERAALDAVSASVRLDGS